MTRDIDDVIAHSTSTAVPCSMEDIDGHIEHIEHR